RKAQLTKLRYERRYKGLSRKAEPALKTSYRKKKKKKTEKCEQKRNKKKKR
ncbi:hypothetical protein IscW_ISCW012769, partial [Ixodes scapularis]